MLDMISFYLFSVLVIGCFSVVVLSSNILYAMSALASGMIFIAGIFFTLGAEFLGVVQISVYTGAVMALYAFGMMFFDNAKEVKENNTNAKLVGILAFGISLMIVAIVLLPKTLVSANNISSVKIENVNKVEIEPSCKSEECLSNLVDFSSLSDIEANSNVKQIGITLFTKYLLPFEIAALMLLIAMIAGIKLALKRQDSTDSIDNITLIEFNKKDKS